jgi:hypothetical protein
MKRVGLWAITLLWMTVGWGAPAGAQTKFTMGVAGGAT